MGNVSMEDLVPLADNWKYISSIRKRAKGIAFGLQIFLLLPLLFLHLGLENQEGSGVCRDDKLGLQH